MCKVPEEQVEKIKQTEFSILKKTEESEDRKKVLATLRYGFSKKPYEDIASSEIVLSRIPQIFRSDGKDVTNAEWALYIATTMYAWHQAGKEKNMNCSGVSFGKAVSMLVHDDTDKLRYQKRLSQITNLRTPKEYRNFMLNMVALLKREDVSMDYVMLAGDLYQIFSYDFTPQFRWAKDFFNGG